MNDLYEVDLGLDRTLYISESAREFFDSYPRIMNNTRVENTRQWDRDIHFSEQSERFVEYQLDKIDWCKQNCLYPWGFMLSNKWFFESEADSVLFSMRWL